MPIRRFRFQAHKVPNESISWIGLGADTKTRLYGTFQRSFFRALDKGRGKMHIEPILRGAVDAINGAATMGPHMAMTSRSEIRLVREEARAVGNITLPFGAHGVTSIPALSTFLVALGPHGLARIVPHKKRIRVLLLDGTAQKISFFKTIRVGATTTGEIVVAACRKEGLGLLVLTKDHRNEIHYTRPFGGLDIIDVCALHDPSKPRAVVALASDGTLCFTSDILSLGPVNVITPSLAIQEAYGIVVQGGHGFILTEDKLLCHPGLTNRLVRNDERSRKTYLCSTDASDLLPIGKNKFALLESGRANEFLAEEFVKTIFMTDEENDRLKGNSGYTDGQYEEGDMSESKQSWEQVNQFDLQRAPAEEFDYA